MHIRARMERPFRDTTFLFALSFSCALGAAIGLASGPLMPLGLLGVLVAAVAAVALRLGPGAITALVFLFCGMMAAGATGRVAPERVRPLLDNEAILVGRVREFVPVDDGWRAPVEGATVSRMDGSGAVVLGKVLLRVRFPDAEVDLPADVRSVGRLYPVKGGTNPGDVPREWTAMALGVQYAFTADASKTVFLPASFPAPRFLRARRRIGNWLLAHAGRGDGALYLRSLTTGEVPPPSHPLVVLLRKTGLAHLLAISGMNVAIFFVVHAYIVRLVLWAFRRRDGTPSLGHASAVVSLPVCWAYVLMAGSPVPAVRSAGMLTAAVFLRQRFGIRAPGFAWAAMFLLTVLTSPFVLLSPSFLLSYGAVFFLLVSGCSDGETRAEETVRKAVARGARQAIRSCVAAFCGTLPISAMFFRSLPTGAILWNLLFGPLLGAGGVAGAFLAALGGIVGGGWMSFPVRIAATGLEVALGILARVSGNGRGNLPLPPPGVVAPFLFTGLSAWGALRLRRAGKPGWPAPLLGAVGFLAWIHLPYIALPDHRLELAALDVGKGAAHVLLFPGGGCMVIDCGSALAGDAGERILLPFLRRKGVRRVDVLVLSHPHEDHYGGAPALLAALPVREIWIPRGVPAGAFGEAVGRFPGRIRPVSAGVRHDGGGASAIVRSAGSDDAGKANAKSLVLEIRFGSLSVWLPGDVEGGPSAWGPVSRDGRETRVLFLPHHGSPGAAPGEWIRAASPDAVVTQNRNCLPGGNLVTSPKVFVLDLGALTLRSDGKTTTWQQEDRSWIWRFLWRLP